MENNVLALAVTGLIVVGVLFFLLLDTRRQLRVLQNSLHDHSYGDGGQHVTLSKEIDTISSRLPSPRNEPGWEGSWQRGRNGGWR